MNLKIVLIFGVITACFLIGGFTVGALVLRGFQGRSPVNTVERSPLSAPMAQTLNEPRLQQNPSADRARLVNDQKNYLESYGVKNADPALFRAHIPIERAMEMIAAGEAPYRQTPQAAAEITAPPQTAPGSGRDPQEGLPEQLS